MLKNAEDLLLGMSELLSDNEIKFVNETIIYRTIHNPKILIEDHKKPDENGFYPTRLVVPDTNFTSVFPKIGYIGIKKLFDSNIINHTSNIIVQASNLKESLEVMNLSKHTCMIFSLYIEAMYPSIKYTMVWNAIEFFSKNLLKKG